MQVEANGTTFHVEEVGSGFPLVFVHGMCGDARVWAEQVGRLSDRYRSISYDRRGHSRSSRTPEVAETVELHADDTAAIIGVMDAVPCLLVGSSGGARIAIDVARRHGELLAGVVLSEPPVGGLAPEQFAGLVTELGPRLSTAVEAGGPPAAVDAFFSFLCPGVWSTVDESVRDRYRANADMLFADLGMPAYQLDAAGIAEIRMPALVIAGGASHPALRDGAHSLAAQLPDVRLVELDCGHVTYAEEPEEFARAVAALAGEITRSAIGRSS